MGGFIFEHFCHADPLNPLINKPGKYIHTHHMEGWMFVKFYAVTSLMFFRQWMLGIILSFLEWPFCRGELLVSGRVNCWVAIPFDPLANLKSNPFVSFRVY